MYESMKIGLLHPNESQLKHLLFLKLYAMRE